MAVILLTLFVAGAPVCVTVDVKAFFRLSCALTMGLMFLDSELNFLHLENFL